MRFVSRLRIPLLLLLCAVSSGCPVSQHPVGVRADAVSEPRLAGTWEGVSGDDDEDSDWRRLHVFADSSATSFDVVAIDDDGWAVLHGYVTVHDGRRYLNLTLRDASDEILRDVRETRETYPYWFAAIRFEDADEVEVAFLVDTISELIRDGRLAGTPGSQQHETRLTSTSDEIASELAAKRDVDVFADALRYRRLTEPK